MQIQFDSPRLQWFYMHSPGTRWCLAKWLACEKGLLHFSQLNGFSPVWVRMWLFNVVAPENVREQKPHLYSLSLICKSTWLLKSDGVANERVHCPHWYGFSGDWEHSCIWSDTRWVNVFKHCRHRHMPNSSRDIPDVWASWGKWGWRAGMGCSEVFQTWALFLRLWVEKLVDHLEKSWCVFLNFNEDMVSKVISVLTLSHLHAKSRMSSLTRVFQPSC